jgi:8-amino-7-oxononanoate synthase
VILGGNRETVNVSEALREKGYWVTPVRPPTVPEGEARLRLSLSYAHSREVLERFIEDIAGIV